MAKTIEPDFDIVVVGGGLVGLTTALALSNIQAGSQLRVCVIAPQNGPIDGRTTALLMPSVDMLSKLGVWKDCKKCAAPLRTMRLIDGTNRLIRAPLTDFKAAEMDLTAFGYNVPNSELIDVLENAIRKNTAVTWLKTSVSTIDCGSEEAALTLEDGSSINTRIVAAADGRNSASRDAAGIEVDKWEYPQTAIVLSFAHSLPHNDISTEFHRETGPFTLVPLPPTSEARHRSSLVWVETPETARELLNHSNNELEGKIETLMQSCLGKVMIEAPAQSFPLSGQTARKFAANRVILLGEAAHVFPPIGAQGFNLGLRDVASFIDLVESRGTTTFDVGAPDFLSSYDAGRRRDVVVTSQAVDMLNRSLLADFLPVQAARALGMATIGQSNWLKRRLMKRGVVGMGNSYRAGNRSGGNNPDVMA